MQECQLRGNFAWASRDCCVACVQCDSLLLGNRNFMIRTHHLSSCVSREPTQHVQVPAFSLSLQTQVHQCLWTYADSHDTEAYRRSALHMRDAVGFRIDQKLRYICITMPRKYPPAQMTAGVRQGKYEGQHTDVHPSNE